MVRITEALVRKKSEHNEMEICSLEELALHQEDIKKIEHIQDWCKNLQILLLQSNLIDKIENLYRLKNLQYLNLAINNIEVIENLERCESLNKLDLTLNFIGNLESVKSLRENIHLRDLYLTGNPCADFKNYRSYVIACLPKLQRLDNTDITKSEKIKASQIFEQIEPQIKEAQNNYRIFREEQKLRYINGNDDEIDDETFWKSKSEHCPETRVAMSKRSRKAKGKDASDDENNVIRSVRCFATDGRPLNVNQAKVKFHFSDEDPKEFVLNVSVYKYLDTSLVEVDIQPIYVKIAIKGKIFQFVLPEEIHTDRSVAQRSQTTGHLVIRMPRVNVKEAIRNRTSLEIKSNLRENKKTNVYLEVTGPKKQIDFANIVNNNETKEDINFVDDPEVPPLE